MVFLIVSTHVSYIPAGTRAVLRTASGETEIEYFLNEDTDIETLSLAFRKVLVERYREVLYYPEQNIASISWCKPHWRTINIERETVENAPSGFCVSVPPIVEDEWPPRANPTSEYIESKIERMVESLEKVENMAENYNDRVNGIRSGSKIETMDVIEANYVIRPVDVVDDRESLPSTDDNCKVCNRACLDADDSNSPRHSRDSNCRECQPCYLCPDCRVFLPERRIWKCFLCLGSEDMQDLPPTVVSDECKQRLDNLRCNWSKAWLETWDVMEHWKAIVDSLLKQRCDLAPGLAFYWDGTARLWVVLPQGRYPRLF